MGVIYSLLAIPVFGQAKLEKFMHERERMHEEWKVSESKKTGIFGNRTKKDMIETLEWMERIIQKDNQIMEELKLLSEIEKTEITYEKNDYKFIVQKQEREIAILKRALEEKNAAQVEKSAAMRPTTWILILFFAFLGFGWKYFRKKI
ncbi:Clp protease ClpB [Mongoliitalea daihaiensis]|nr:Clp protease ClpB [Mongoliitalea daihaiensis]